MEIALIIILSGIALYFYLQSVKQKKDLSAKNLKMNELSAELTHSKNDLSLQREENSKLRDTIKNYKTEVAYIRVKKQ